MTNSDLQQARDVLDDGFEGRPSDNRGLVLVAAGAAVALAVGIAGWQALAEDSPAAPEPSSAAPVADAGNGEVVLSTADRAFLAGDAPTPELLQGIWRLDNPTDSNMLFAFTGDGGFRYDDSGNLAAEPLVWGTYRIEGNLLSVDVDGGSAQCAGQTIELRAATNPLGGVNLLPASSDPTVCGRPVRRQWVLEQLLPTNQWWDDFKAPRGNNWDPPAGHDALLGTWLAGADRYLIELREDGTYTRLAGTGEAVDRGLWADAASTTMLTLTSSAESSTCRPGDKFMLTNLRARDIGTLAIQGDVVRDDCGMPPWHGWFLLAP